MRLLYSCIAIAILLVASACEERTELEPTAEGTTRGEVVATDVAGVRMGVQPDTWPGALDVREEVTPVQVTIENNSGQPLRVQYSQFALVDPEGEEYAALPPFEVEGEVDSPALAEGYDPVMGADTDFADYQVLPYYQDVYPGAAPYTHPTAFNPAYYESYYEYWDATDLPTPEMLERALPEGVLTPAGVCQAFSISKR